MDLRQLIFLSLVQFGCSGSSSKSLKGHFCVLVALTAEEGPWDGFGTWLCLGCSRGHEELPSALVAAKLGLSRGQFPAQGVAGSQGGWEREQKAGGSLR